MTSYKRRSRRINLPSEPVNQTNFFCFLLLLHNLWLNRSTFHLRHAANDIHSGLEFENRELSCLVDWKKNDEI